MFIERCLKGRAVPSVSFFSSSLLAGLCGGRRARTHSRRSVSLIRRVEDAPSID